MPESYTYLNRPAAQALYQALIDEDPFYITLEQAVGKDPDETKEAMLRYMDYAMKEAQDAGELVLPRHRPAPGAAVFSRPVSRVAAARAAQEKKTFIKTHMGRVCLDTYTQIVTFMAEQSRDLVAEDAWYLSILGVAPDCQGRGIGKSMVLTALEMTDRMGVEVFIESFTPSNFGFYRHLGFETAKTVFEPVTRSEYAIMVRPPA